jgi:hypothetical protein
VSLPRPVALLRAAAVFALLALLPLSFDTSAAQIQDGATMTVLRGQVAVIFGDGSAMQPAPSGTIVRAGDEIRTVGSSAAAITFFVGTEVELGADTILVVERVSGRDGTVDVSLKQVFGATLNRIQTFTDPRSVYRIEAGGAVAVVRGTEFLIYGPTPEGIVVIVCLRDCDGDTTFANCPMSPFMGYWVQVQNGRVISQCEAFAARRNYYDAALEAVTAAQQRLQGDIRRVPAGQVQSGQRQEIESNLRNPEEDDDHQQGLVTTTPMATTTSIPTVTTVPTGTAVPTTTLQSTLAPTATTGVAPGLPSTSTPTATASATSTTSAVPAASINDVWLSEGDAGQTLTAFTVSLARRP